jgi:putative transposase
MITILSLSFPCSRSASAALVASLELELIALQAYRSQAATPSPPLVLLIDCLFWVWLYRLRPQLLDTLVLVKPATVIGWHRKGLSHILRWRSRRPGRSKTNAEIRDLIHRMSAANPFWGAPRIHGELLKLGVEVSPATVGRYAAAPQGRIQDLAQLSAQPTEWHGGDRHVYCRYRDISDPVHLIVLDHDRRKIIHFGVTENPTQVWLTTR